LSLPETGRPPEGAPLAPARWKAALAWAAYSTVMRLALPALIVRAWRRGQAEPVYAQRWPERLGLRYPQGGKQAGVDAPLVWLHAVSLGETRASVPLIHALREALPGMRLLLTCTTATGWTAGEGLLQPGDLHTWMPFDTPGAVRRFLRHHRPSVGVLMETEVWPNVQREAARAGLPMVLANARLSDKSLRQGLRFAPLLQPAARAMTLALAQTDADARRLRQMGVADVRVSGNLKFDVRPDPRLVGAGRQWRARLGRPVVVFASSREGEEAPLLAAWVRQVPAGPGSPLLLLVPRHPQRFDEVAAQVDQAGLSLARRSSWLQQPRTEALYAQVWLGDSMGEMPLYYGVGDVCLLGGSFQPLGGQNLIEAMACGCHVVMGPSTFNFEEAARIGEDEGGATRVGDVNEALAVALAHLRKHNPDAESRQPGIWMSAHSGSARRMAKAVGGLISRQTAPLIPG
jgi:3-deoxy-D-manno-octulosonic-acid transferase